MGVFRKGLVLALASLLLFPVPGLPDPPKETLERIREELEMRERVVREKERQERELNRQLRSVSSRVGELEGKMEALQRAYKDLEREMEGLTKEISGIEGKIDGLKGRLGKRIVALLEIRRGGLAEVLLSSRSYGDLLLRARVLGAVLKRDAETLSELSRLLEERRAKLEGLREAQSQLAKKAYELQSVKEELAEKKGEVERLLERVARERRRELERIAYLERRKRALEQLVKNLRTPPPSPLAALARGFPLPVKGTLKTLPHYEGIAIYCPEGAEVRVVGGGRIAFASRFEGYGNLIIVDHGQGLHTVYAHLGRILKGPGEEVRAGEVIALAGPGDGGGGMVYFEVRKNGRCEPPGKWLALPIAEGGKR